MRRMARTVRMLSAFVVAGVLLAGCGPLDDMKGPGGVVAGMNMQGAAEHADAMLYATVGAIKPEIVWVHDTTTTGSCDVTRYWVVMTVVSEERRGSFLGVVERFWKKSGYKITGMHASKERPRLYAVSPEGFGISLVFGYKGQAFFEVTTPCVDKSEVTGPEKPSNGPTYEGDVPTPDVRSDFWSATTPVPGPSS
ncbi:hypothetical protein [Streptomyces sp. NPDC088915]|uniref:hypothetical protein n=1 Tax=Streptomyces sp. NPDC088915 TaxID=3365912 RepID=UPI0038235E2B